MPTGFPAPSSTRGARSRHASPTSSTRRAGRSPLTARRRAVAIGTSTDPIKGAAVPWRRVRPQREIADRMLKALCTVFTGLGVLVLGWILAMLIWEGVSALSPDIFTRTMPGPGSEGGGLANAIVGSVILTVLGIAVAT